MLARNIQRERKRRFQRSVPSLERSASSRRSTSRVASQSARMSPEPHVNVTPTINFEQKSRNGFSSLRTLIIGRRGGRSCKRESHTANLETTASKPLEIPVVNTKQPPVARLQLRDKEVPRLDEEITKAAIHRHLKESGTSAVRVKKVLPCFASTTRFETVLHIHWNPVS